jgi:hypothetical protein
MPFWIAKVAGKTAWKRVPWSMVLTVSVWLVEKGRERLNENLTKKERSELLHLVVRSRGLPGNLAQRERTRLKNIAGKAIKG